MTRAFYVVLDKSAARKLNFSRNLNRGRLKEDFRQIILENARPTTTSKYKQERIVCGAAIDQVLPSRPAGSYRILDREVLYIQDPEAFWSFDDVLVIITD